MRSRRISFVVGLALASVAPACGSISGVLQNDGGQNDGSSDTGRPACSSLDETACRARPDCVAETCGDCSGGSTFIGCGTPSDGHSCPAILCPLPCAQATTKDACDARTDCHSVYTDPGTCGCASAGCCARFSGCADGGQATCKPSSGLACAIAQPYCESPYVVSYTNNCYEGCVLSTECAP